MKLLSWQINFRVKLIRKWSKLRLIWFFWTKQKKSVLHTFILEIFTCPLSDSGNSKLTKTKRLKKINYVSFKSIKEKIS